MILVIGGAAAGKRAYIHSLGYSDEQVADAALEPGLDAASDTRPVLANLQELVFANVEGAPALLPALLDKAVVSCDEVGSGVIPGVRGDRLAREATGRLCNQLAQQAEQVIRLVAGIPQMIKG